MKVPSLLLILAIQSVSFASAQVVLQGEVNKKVWTVEDARNAVLQGALRQVNLDHDKPLDPGYALNIQVVKRGGGIEKLKEGGYKQITAFSQGVYSVTIYSKEQYEKRNGNPPTRYYDSQGHLITVAFTVGKKIPRKIYAHCYGQYCAERGLPLGSLVWQSIDVTEDESYVFEPNGRLNVRWKGAYCYKEDGTVCGRRTSAVEKYAGNY